MNVSIFVIALTWFSIDSALDSLLRYTLFTSFDFVFFFITRFMCSSVIIVVCFSVSLDSLIS